MSHKGGLNRFLSRREKKSPQTHQKAERKPDHFGGLFANPNDPNAKTDKEQDKRVKAILDRLRLNGIDTMVEANAEYALQASHGDSEAAYKLLVLLQWTYEGIVEPYDPQAKLVGAVNRHSVTCYADALLFAMFARLDSFEAMLYDSYEDLPRRKLAGVLRLWVNMLRTGRLITTDVTWYLQNALTECGWGEAGKLKQQDPSEAFTFITGQLGLPLLTLKMDLYHTGKEDPQDDHKFVNERLLEVAIPDAPEEGSDVITLEQCLEHYFNNRIEVKRHLERRRRDTLKSSAPDDATLQTEKEPAMHVEVVELAEASTPVVSTPITESPTQFKSPLDKLRPTASRKRADSIFSQRRIELTGIDPEALTAADPNAPADGPLRKMSTRTEVLMPAWQFFKLLPWYTDHLPTSDAQVAAHFSKKRPVLGVCLKRYSYTYQGQAQRRDTYVDIPLEIGVPNFVSDDHMNDEGPLVGNFRLQLQSVVCHRGMSVNSGHYIALCRGTASNAVHGSSTAESRRGSLDSDTVEDPWMRFDDLARERVTYVDIHQALRDETPYLLFYQVLPIGDDGHSIHDLPSYAEATTSRSHSDADTLEKPYLNSALGSENALTSSMSNLTSEAATSEATDFANGSQRVSLDAVRTLDGPRGRASYQDERRPSIAFDEGSYAGSTSGGSVRTDPVSMSAPSTPSEEKGNTFLAVANKLNSRRGSKVSKTGSRSRPTTPGPDPSANRLSFSMSKLTQRMSRNDVPAVQPSEAVAAELAGQIDASEKVSPPEHAGKEVIGEGVKRSSSKETLETLKPPLPKPVGRRDKAASRHEKRKGKGHTDDRDCVVM